MDRKTCFFIMPFRPELNFVWLYLSKHIEEKHKIRCFRGDSVYQAIPLNEKLLKMIEDADIIVADVTDKNPNVMYELGIADNMGKKVIAIYQKNQGINQIPTDIKYKEFIQYSLDDHLNLISQLDQAIDNLLGNNYINLYDLAIKMLRDFNNEEQLQCSKTDKDTFMLMVRNSEQVTGIPPLENEIRLKEFLLPKIIRDSTRPHIMQKILHWLSINK